MEVTGKGIGRGVQTPDFITSLALHELYEWPKSAFSWEERGAENKDKEIYKSASKFLSTLGILAFFRESSGSVSHIEQFCSFDNFSKFEQWIQIKFCDENNYNGIK